MSGFSEIQETENLLQQAKFPGVKRVLQAHLDSLLRTATAVEPSAPQPAATEVESPAVAATIIAPATVTPRRPVVSGTNFIPIVDFAWDQGSYNSDTITIFVDLKGVGKVEQHVNCEFTKMSFDLTVTDLEGKNYRLIKDNLEKDIVPAESKFIVKANKVLIKLKKVKGEYSYESWTNLTAKKKRDPTTEASKKKEPMGGIMDMMRDMYEDGDENMRKIIGEAMLKSQRGEKSAPPSMDMDI